MARCYATLCYNMALRTTTKLFLSSFPESAEVQWLTHLPLEVPGPRFDPRSRQGKFYSPNTLSLVSFAGMTQDDKCIVLRIGTLTGCPLCRESHPLCRLKNPTVISIWFLVGFHLATWSVQCTPADKLKSERRAVY